jgi:hypothetical protein
MRMWIIAALAVLSLGVMAPLPAAAEVAIAQNTESAPPPAGPEVQGAPGAQNAPGAQHHRHRYHRRHHHHRHYYTRCHNVRVWKSTPHGRVPVWERRCHRVWH